MSTPEHFYTNPIGEFVYPFNDDIHLRFVFRILWAGYIVRISPLISGVAATFNCNRRLHLGQRTNGTLFMRRFLIEFSTATGSVMHQSSPCFAPAITVCPPIACNRNVVRGATYAGQDTLYIFLKKDRPQPWS